MSVSVIVGTGPDRGDGVGDFAWLLAHQMARSRPVTVILPEGEAPGGGSAGIAEVATRTVPPGWGAGTARAILGAIGREGGTVLVHFVPQLYGWYGAKPGLAWILARLRATGCRIVTVVHEFGVPIGWSPARSGLALAHRVLLRTVVRASHRVVVTTPFVEDLFRRRYPGRVSLCRRIPVSSTIPVVPLDERRRRALRSRWAAGGDTVLVALFASELRESAEGVRHLVAQLDGLGVSVRLAVLGNATTAFCERLGELPRPHRVIALGPVSREAASACLGSADLYAAFYPDGASTRRTSLMAGLAHGLPVLTTHGALTDAALATCEGVVFLDRAGARELLEALVRSAEFRRCRGAAGRAWYDAHCGWDVVGEAYRRVIDEVER